MAAPVYDGIIVPTSTTKNFLAERVLSLENANDDGGVSGSSNTGVLGKGNGLIDRVAFWTDTDTISSDSDFIWDATTNRLVMTGSIELSGSSGIASIVDLQSKRVANVKAFGATGDGTTDDTQAILDAFAYIMSGSALQEGFIAGAAIRDITGSGATSGFTHWPGSGHGGVVYFPKGIYLQKSEIFVESGSLDNVVICGEGNQSVIWANDYNGSHIKFRDANKITIRDLCFIGDGIDAAKSTGGLLFQAENLGACARNLIENVFLTGITNDGVNMKFPTLTKLQNVTCQLIAGHGIVMDTGTSVTLENCYSLTGLRAGFRFKNQTYSSMINCATEGFGIGYDINNSKACSLVACGAEQTVDKGFVVDGGAFGTLPATAPYTHLTASLYPGIGYLISGNRISSYDCYATVVHAMTGSINNQLFVSESGAGGAVISLSGSRAIYEINNGRMDRINFRYQTIETSSDPWEHNKITSPFTEETQLGPFYWRHSGSQDTTGDDLVTAATSSQNMLISGSLDVDGNEIISGSLIVSGSDLTVLGGKIGIGVTNPGETLSILAETPTQRIESTDTAVKGLEINRTSYFGKDTGGGSSEYASIVAVIGGADANFEAGELRFNIVDKIVAGAEIPFLVLQGKGLVSGKTAAVVFNSASQDIDFIVDTKSFFIEGSSGKVGIGTSTPATNLHIFDTGDPTIVLDTGGTDWAIGIDDSEGDRFFINTGQVAGSQFTIETAGNVGIGMGAPTARLHISGSTAAQELLRIQNSTGDEMLFVSSSGKVGIGSTTPSATFEVFPDTDVLGIIGKARIGHMNSSLADWAGFSHFDVTNLKDYALIQNASGRTLLNASSSQKIEFRLDNVTKMQLLPTGNLDVLGTVGGGQPDFALRVRGDSFFTGSLTVGRVAIALPFTLLNSSGGAATIGMQFHTGDHGKIAEVRAKTLTATTGRLEFHTEKAGTVTEQFRIDHDGGLFAFSLLGAAASSDVNINASNEIFKVTSARKYKKDITDIKIDTTKLYNLRPRSFIHLSDPEIQTFGLIAEEVLEQIPELVVLNNSGSVESVKYSMLSVLLLNELQAVDKRLKAIEEKLGM